MRAQCEQCTTAPKGIFVMRLKLAATAALVLVVAGCGYSREDRVTGGAAAGAATGAAVGIVGGPVGMLAGAAIGGGAGLLGGFLYDQYEKYRGRSNSESAPVSPPAGAD